MNTLRDVSDYYAAHNAEWTDLKGTIAALGTPSSDPNLPSDFNAALANWQKASAGVPTILAATPSWLQDITPDNGLYDVLEQADVPALNDLANRAATAGGNLSNWAPLPQPQAPDPGLDVLNALGPLDVIGSLTGQQTEPAWLKGVITGLKWIGAGAAVVVGLAVVDKGIELAELVKGR